jgi:hypothetical protein
MKRLSMDLLLATVLMLGLTGCRLPGDEGDRFSGIGVLNSTAIELRFKIMAHGEWVDLGTIDPHQSDLVILPDNASLLTNGCTTSDLVADAPDGTEYARHSPPLCSSESVIWVIEDYLPFPS